MSSGLRPKSPTTPIPEPSSGVDEDHLMDYAAALALTLPKNADIYHVTVFLSSTGEPAEGYTGRALVKHCKYWTQTKDKDEIVDTLQGLMYLGVIACVGTQSDESKMPTFQNDNQYLYGFDETKINIYKCASRGKDHVNMKKWDEYFQSDPQTLKKNKRINKGGIVSEAHAAPIEITFVTHDGQEVTSERLVSVATKQYNGRLTQDEILKRRARTKAQQDKINQSMQKKGQKQWKWKTHDKKRNISANSKHNAYSDENESKSDTVVKKTLTSYGDNSYPIGSDDIRYYNAGQTCRVWNNNQWVDAQVVEVIKFVKTVKVNVDGKTQSIRLPNLDLIRLTN